MVEKHVVDPQKSDGQNIIELTNKFNELIESLGRRPRPPALPQPNKSQYVEYLEKMGQRMRSGPLMALYQEDPNALTKAIDDSLTAFQNAVATYKASLPTGG